MALGVAAAAGNRSYNKRATLTSPSDAAKCNGKLPSCELACPAKKGKGCNSASNNRYKASGDANNSDPVTHGIVVRRSGCVGGGGGGTVLWVGWCCCCCCCCTTNKLNCRRAVSTRMASCDNAPSNNSNRGGVVILLLLLAGGGALLLLFAWLWLLLAAAAGGGGGGAAACMFLPFDDADQQAREREKRERMPNGLNKNKYVLLLPAGRVRRCCAILLRSHTSSCSSRLMDGLLRSNEERREMCWTSCWLHEDREQCSTKKTAERESMEEDVVVVVCC